MRLYSDIIQDKRDGKALSSQEIKQFLNGYLQGNIADYQMSAMLMAVYFQGLNPPELHAWTQMMLESGLVMDFTDIPGIKLDKHSTGGVGDKISIPLAPALAALGLYVPMISGRGLGHTGGTLDKLESIPGFNTVLSLADFKRQVSQTGCALIGQTNEIAPLDKRLYALRDVTATVDSIPLIASSIMSKKVAEGINYLLLDIKVGAGAFMKDLPSAKALAETMIGIGRKFGVKVTALFTRMDEPLGYAVGNSLEILESLEVLAGIDVPQVTELVVVQGAILLEKSGTAGSFEQGKLQMREVLQDGRAYQKFREIIQRQGGGTGFTGDLIPKARFVKEIASGGDGFLEKTDALGIGKALIALGGGRCKQEDPIDHSVGFIFHKKNGDKVGKEEKLLSIHYNDEQKLKEAMAYIENAISISETKAESKPIYLGQLD